MSSRLAAVLISILLVLAGCGPAAAPSDYPSVPFAETAPPPVIAEWAASLAARPGVWVRTEGQRTYVVASWGKKSHPGSYRVEITDLERGPEGVVVVEVALHFAPAGEIPAQPPTDLVSFTEFQPTGFRVKFAPGSPQFEY